MSWFIIAKDHADWKRWSGLDKCWLFVVGADGNVAGVDYTSEIPSNPFLAVLNMAWYPRDVTEDSIQSRSVLLQKLGMAFPVNEVEGLFVHFGGYDPEAAGGNRDEVQTKWRAPSLYPGLADIFEGLDVFPYSANAGGTWSADLRNLAGQIKDSCSPDTAPVAAKLDGWQKLLKSAKEKAGERYADQTDAATRADAELAIRALMPVFIYLDGLLYAHGIEDETERNQKVKGMEEVIRADIKGALEGISPPLRQSSPKAIQDVVAQLDSGEGELRAIAEIFCREYREFLKDVTPESAAKDEPT